MKFNPGKCEMMHFGESANGRTYTVNGRTPDNVDEQGNLWVEVYSSLNVATVDRMVKKAYCKLPI